jgi:hypothetical protein
MSRCKKFLTVLYHGEPFRYFYEAQSYTPCTHPAFQKSSGLPGWQLFFKDLWHERLRERNYGRAIEY